MSKDECGSLLLLVQAVDNREVSLITIEAWHEIVGHLPFDVARAALAEVRRASNRWVTPADIIDAAKDPWAGRERFGGPSAA